MRHLDVSTFVILGLAPFGGATPFREGGAVVSAVARTVLFAVEFLLLFTSFADPALAEPKSGSLLNGEE
jgi:hypothetical protein